MSWRKEWFIIDLYLYRNKLKKNVNNIYNSTPILLSDFLNRTTFLDDTVFGKMKALRGTGSYKSAVVNINQSLAKLIDSSRNTKEIVDIITLDTA
jgi:threonine dehydratase